MDEKTYFLLGNEYFGLKQKLANMSPPTRRQTAIQTRI